MINIENLGKSYGKQEVLKDFNLSIDEGKIIGILGPNGSGKTTLMKIMAGLINNYKGKVEIENHSPGVYTKSIVSYLPDKSHIYRDMKIIEVIKFFKDFYSDFNETKADELIKFMELDKNKKVSELSKGMSEKLSLSMALARDAKVYILDEPISGVDIVSRDKILEAIIRNYAEGSTMIITTHLVREMEGIFEEVMFIKGGKIVLEGNLEDLREEKNQNLEQIYKSVFENKE